MSHTLCVEPTACRPSLQTNPTSYGALDVPSAQAYYRQVSVSTIADAVHPPFSGLFIMPLTLVCMSCGARLRAPDNAAGQTFECPKCGKQGTANITTEPQVATICTPPVASACTPPSAPDPNSHVSTTSSAITCSPLDASETLTPRTVPEREETQPSTFGPTMTMTLPKGSVMLATPFFSMALCVYGISLFLPTYEMVIWGRPDIGKGYHAFLWGAILPRLWIPWLANPLFWFGAICFVAHRYQWALIGGIMALAASTSTTLWLFYGPEHGPQLFIGYYLWMVSTVLLSLAAIIPIATEAQSIKRKESDEWSVPKYPMDVSQLPEYP